MAGVSTAGEGHIVALPRADDPGLPVGMLSAAASSTGDASGSSNTAYVDLPYGYAFSPLYVSCYISGGTTARPAWWRLQEGHLVNGQTMLRNGIFPAPTYITSSGFGQLAGEQLRPYLYFPDDRGQAAVHRIQVTTPNVNGETIALFFRSLLFDPDVAKRGPLGALGLFLMH